MGDPWEEQAEKEARRDKMTMEELEEIIEGLVKEVRAGAEFEKALKKEMERKANKILPDGSKVIHWMNYIKNHAEDLLEKMALAEEFKKIDRNRKLTEEEKTLEKYILARKLREKREKEGRIPPSVPRLVKEVNELAKKVKETKWGVLEAVRPKQEERIELMKKVTKRKRRRK